jgi:glycosyltransferase involved in cell wall biosynthesis
MEENIKSIFTNTEEEIVDLPNPLISICVISSDEDMKRNLKIFLDNLPKSPDIELIFVENEQTDGEESIEVIKDIVRLKQLKWKYKEFSFAVARNIAKSYATGDWIISLDMDDIIPSFIHKDLIEFLKTADPNMKAIKVGIVSSARNFKTGGYDRLHSEMVKIFRNLDSISWVGNVHEMVEWTINEKNIYQSNFSFYHTGYDLCLDDILNKLKRNIKLVSSELAYLDQKKTPEQYLFYVDYMKRTIDTYIGLTKN